MNKELKQYLDERILPLYNQVDKGHGPDHIINCLNFAISLWQHNFKEYVREELIYVAIYYHDLGLLTNREHHHLISGEILEGDMNLRKWFTDEEIISLVDAVINHRASNGNPVSLLAKIVSDADRSEIDIRRMMYRSYAYNLKFEEMTIDERIENGYVHLKEKYGKNGYVKWRLKETEDELKDIIEESRLVLNNKDLFYSIMKTEIIPNIKSV